MTRRDALGAALLATLAAPSAAVAGIASPDEADALQDLIAGEHGSAFAYEEAQDAVPELGELATLGAHARDHALALATELAAIGLNTRPAPRRAVQLGPLTARVAAARDRAAVLAAAIALEEALARAYRRALTGLPDAKIAMTAATVLASHAQHLVLLRRLAGRDPLAAA